MIGRTSLLKATALSLSLGLAATAAQAGSIADVAKQTDELSMFSEAITAAGLDRQLAGEGLFTVFAPTNQAFEQLPKGALEELMKQENQAQLSKLLEHHVVQGEALAAEEVVGRQTKLDTMSGDTLTVDATSGAVLLVPTGLTIAQVGDQLVIEREGVAVSTHAIEVEDQMVRKAGDEQQRIQGQQPQEELAAAETTPTAEPSDMPMTEHQQQVLKSEPGQEQHQTAGAAGTDMPATEHQRQVLAEEELPGEQQQSYEQARVEGRPDILREASVVAAGVQADNGVIHVIDAVLVPQSVLETLESAEGQG